MGIGLHVFELRRLLDLALDLVDNLLLQFVNGCAGPEYLHNHDAEGEVRVFLLAQIGEREQPRGEDEHEQKAREARMLDSPTR